MKKFTGHNEEDWGGFVDVKINATGLLQREVKKKQVGEVGISGVCDPYQPLEKKYELTKGCLKILLKSGWPVTIQTKSPLVLRDLELLMEFDEIEVGLTITTADENIRKIFEPNAPPIKQRYENCIGQLVFVHPVKMLGKGAYITESSWVIQPNSLDELKKNITNFYSSLKGFPLDTLSSEVINQKLKEHNIDIDNLMSRYISRIKEHGVTK